MADLPSDPLVVLTTLPGPEHAAAIARALIEAEVAACVNLVPAVRSIYRWQGAIHDEAETLAIIKTTRACYDALAAKLIELHPYDVPELLALPVAAGHPAYMAWLTDSCTRR